MFLILNLTFSNRLHASDTKLGLLLGSLFFALQRIYEKSRYFGTGLVSIYASDTKPALFFWKIHDFYK